MTETVGPLLRAARETQGRTLEEVEAVLHIRARHLASLEADDYVALPSLAQARGFLKNYAQYLGLDLQDTLGLYEAALRQRPTRAAPRPPANPAAPGADLSEPGRARADARVAARQSGQRTQVGVRSSGRPSTAPNPVRLPAPAPVRRRWRLSTDLLVALVLTLMLGALLVWGGWQIYTTFVLAPTATATVALAGLGGTPGAATATLAPEATATVALPTPAESYVGVNLTVRADQRTWVSVTVDGQPSFAGLMLPGEAREFIGQGVVEVLTGNGLATRVIWNGVDQGVLGTLGQVVTRLWTLDGMVIPTPTPTELGQAATPDVTATAGTPAAPE